jgi:aminoglycoside 3-N-acetyltransferase
MTEADAVKNTPGLPPTVESLTRDLRALGVQPGMLLFVHTSLSSLGWVVGGAHAVILSLEEAIGPDGTLVMPMFTGGLTEPSGWRDPPVPESWWQIIRDHMPAFDVNLTPPREIGIVAETFRKQPGTIRSYHPDVSFAARGPLAEELMADHPIDFGHGDGSPLGRMYDHGCYVLMIGVGHINNTSFHLAEFRAGPPTNPVWPQWGPVMVDGVRRWVEFKDIECHEELFPRIGEDFERETGYVRIGKVGYAESRLIPQREMVDYAVEWLRTHASG